MRTIKKSAPADDSVNPSWMKPFSIEQIPAVTKFLPDLESIKPKDLERIVKPPALAEDKFVVGRPEYHPAVYEFMRACYDRGFGVNSNLNLKQIDAEGQRVSQLVLQLTLKDPEIEPIVKDSSVRLKLE